MSCFQFWGIPAFFSCASLGLMAALGAFSAHPAASPPVLQSIQHGCYAAGAAGLASYACRRRRQLRQLEGVPEGPLSDWWSYFWCPGLSVRASCSGCSGWASGLQCGRDTDVTTVHKKTNLTNPPVSACPRKHCQGLPGGGAAEAPPAGAAGCRDGQPPARGGAQPPPLQRMQGS